MADDLSLEITHPVLSAQIWGGKTIEEKFPLWLGARAVVTEWVDNINGWAVTPYPDGSVNIGLTTRDGKAYPVEFVPDPDQRGFDNIFSTVMRDMIAEICREFLNYKMTILILSQLQQVLENREYEIVIRTGYGIKAELARTFGIDPSKWMHMLASGQKV